MTLSPDESPVLRGADLHALPVASLIAAPAEPEPQPEPEPEAADEGPDVETLVAEARQHGYDEGLAAAEAGLRETFQNSLAALELAARDLVNARSAWENTGPAQVVGVALEIAEMIMMREVATASDPGRDALVRCLTEIPVGDKAVVRLHPADLDRMGAVDDLAIDRSFDLVGDDAVASGDAIADTTTGSVDARLRGALGRVREELLR